MTATTRSKVIELSKHEPTQVIIFFVLALGCAWLLLSWVFLPLLSEFFHSFMRMTVVYDGSIASFRLAEDRKEELVETGYYSLWALANSDIPVASRTSVAPVIQAQYVFQPIIALFPLIIIGGIMCATLISSLVPRSIGYIRQKIEREILNTLDRITMLEYGEHTSVEIAATTKAICKADSRRLHDIAAQHGIPFTDLLLLQKALLWRDSTGIAGLIRIHDAIKFYMREYFTIRYSNTVLGLVYIGAAVLIIVIGLRGLKFLPATDPSVVLGALGLEFILLMTYAVVLMYGRPEESSNFIMDGGRHANVVIDADTEQILRAFLATPRKDGERE